LNSSFCLPVDENEILAQRGWLKADELTTDDKVLSIEPATNQCIWADVHGVNIFDWGGTVYDWKSKNFSAAMTPDHRWMVKDYAGRNQMRRAEDLHNLSGAQIVLAGGDAANFSEVAQYDDAFVALAGWFATEGTWAHGCYAIEIGQSTIKNPEFCVQIDAVAAFYEEQGVRVTTRVRLDRMKDWYFPVAIGSQIRAVIGAKKTILPEFLAVLTKPQAELLYHTLLAGDGGKDRERFYQSDWGLLDSFQMLAMLLGKRSIAKLSAASRDKHGEFDGTVGVHQSKVAWLGHMKRTSRHYRGRVWCPTTSTGTWVTRRVEGHDRGQGNEFRKTVYLTGDCFPE
jgi:ribonucleoside-triphosphate reductase (formate)